MKNYSNETKQSELKTDEEWYKEILEFIAPDTEHWVVIVLIIFTFLLGIGGNLLVCLAVWRNRNLRTLTNIHLVNLAVADFLVIAVCLPPTLLQDAMESWFLGTIGCKIVIYLQVRTPFFDDFFFFFYTSQNIHIQDGKRQIIYSFQFPCPRDLKCCYMKLIACTILQFLYEHLL